MKKLKWYLLSSLIPLFRSEERRVGKSVSVAV